LSQDRSRAILVDALLPDISAEIVALAILELAHGLAEVLITQSLLSR
jgi:hypothetical protein